MRRRTKAIIVARVARGRGEDADADDDNDNGGENMDEDGNRDDDICNLISFPSND